MQESDNADQDGAENDEQAWVFCFFLEAQDGRLLSSSAAEDLLDQIISWVEEKGLQIGGGFRPPTHDEANPEPYSLREK